MAGLDQAIHVSSRSQDLDARHKAGHDGLVRMTHTVIARSETTKRSRGFSVAGMDCFASLAMTK
jgi:hypothetical protein